MRASWLEQSGLLRHAKYAVWWYCGKQHGITHGANKRFGGRTTVGGGGLGGVGAAVGCNMGREQSNSGGAAGTCILLSLKVAGRVCTGLGRATGWRQKVQSHSSGSLSQERDSLAGGWQPAVEVEGRVRPAPAAAAAI